MCLSACPCHMGKAIIMQSCHGLWTMTLSQGWSKSWSKVVLRKWSLTWAQYPIFAAQLWLETE